MNHKTLALIGLLTIAKPALAPVPPFLFGALGITSGVTVYNSGRPTIPGLAGLAVMATSAGRTMLDIVRPTPPLSVIKANRAFAIGSIGAFALLMKADLILAKYQTEHRKKT